MSDILEALYGTGGSEALEKAAQAKFVEKLASEYNVDLSELSAEQLEQLEQAVAADLADGNTETVEEADGDIEKAAAAYDAYGRVMAHGFLDELQKTAEPASEADEDYVYVDEAGNEYSREEVEGELAKEALPAWLGKLVEGGKGAAGKVGKFLDPRQMYHGATDIGVGASRARGAGLKGLLNLKGAKGAARREGAAARKYIGRGLKRVGKGAILPGAAAAGAFGGYKAMKKKSSALDTLADQRAQEILGMFGHEKVASDSELDDAVTVAAFQKLEAAGYPVNEMIDALKGAE